MYKTVTPLIIIVVTFFVWRELKVSPAPPPCSTPITYSIGIFDRRFGLSQKEFLVALSEAEVIWEKPLGKELFAYNPKTDNLPINLVYDYRQHVTEQLSTIEGGVKESEATYRALEQRYLAAHDQYLSLKSSYDARVSMFDTDEKDYQSAVDAWNNSSRNSRDDFTTLETQRRAVEAELGEIKTLETTLNESARVANALVVELNSLARSLNLNVKQYNTIGASRGETFTGGIYTSDASGERIDIFEFKNHDKLVRVLAHELGHALGLEHVDDPKAIMYKLNEGEAEKLTATDLNALKTLCKIN